MVCNSRELRPPNFAGRAPKLFEVLRPVDLMPRRTSSILSASEHSLSFSLRMSRYPSIYVEAQKRDGKPSHFHLTPRLAPALQAVPNPKARPDGPCRALDRAISVPAFARALTSPSSSRPSAGPNSSCSTSNPKDDGWLTSRPSALLNFPAKLCTGNRPPCSRLSALIRAALSAAAPASAWIASPPEARKTMRAETVPNAQPPVDARTAREPAVATSLTDAASNPAATTATQQ